MRDEILGVLVVAYVCVGAWWMPYGPGLAEANKDVTLAPLQWCYIGGIFLFCIIGLILLMKDRSKYINQVDEVHRMRTGGSIK